ncbi:hypothetical protein DIJ61_04365 [Burkholderia pseudomallei]|nr:hypothetical protein DIJ61_04365 [Burkholderia pseudomallei]
MDAIHVEMLDFALVTQQCGRLRLCFISEHRRLFCYRSFQILMSVLSMADGDTSPCSGFPTQLHESTIAVFYWIVNINDRVDPERAD